jgi:NAD(P)-dependent dehydrogenase (short-subunit alcohol dehydrogenase family)
VLGRLRSQIPAGRSGRPEEIVRVVAVRADGDSSYSTGQIWAVNCHMGVTAQNVAADYGVSRAERVRSPSSAPTSTSGRT